MERYEALPKTTRDDMENRFMWAVSTGEPDATVEKAVATIIAPLLDQLEGAVDALVDIWRANRHDENRWPSYRAGEALGRLGIDPSTYRGQ